MSKRYHLEALDPYLLFLLFIGVGLGTVLLPQPVRMAVLWTTLALLSVFYRGQYKVSLDFSLSALGRGALLGGVVSLPLLAFLSTQLQPFVERLYATQDIVALFYQICFVAAPVEEYFLRGVLRETKGASISIALYAVTALLYFLPHAPVLASLIMLVGMGLFGLVYNYVRERYGLAAAIACHVVVGFFLQVMPSVLKALRLVLF
ncbi:MAG: CPBP family intramembrane metalloprotease [Anaerolineae bacterium]|nr:CPBP family intramembrane metalloprotease [Anaerolineae bacterium]